MNIKMNLIALLVWYEFITIASANSTSILSGRPQDLCYFAPCRAPSVCENVGNDFACHCKNKVKGKRCDRPMSIDDNVCLSLPCWNGGTCQSKILEDQEKNDVEYSEGSSLKQEWTCICPHGTTGKVCHIVDESYCGSANPCQNNGVCKLVRRDEGGNSIMEPVCECPPYWTGRYCQLKVDQCDDKQSVCMNNGKCINGKCSCLLNWTGRFCESTAIARIKSSYMAFENNEMTAISLKSKFSVVRVRNRGFMIARVSVTTSDRSLLVGEESMQYEQRHIIGILGEQLFIIPINNGNDSSSLVIITVDVLWGPTFSMRALREQECIKLSGVFISPYWSRIECS